MKKKNEVTIPTTQPKPTKTELVEALLVIAESEHSKRISAYEAARDGLKKDLADKLAKLVTKNGSKMAPKLNVYGCVVELEFRFRAEDFAPAMAAIWAELEGLKHPGKFDPKAARSEIIKSMNGGPRCRELLADAEFVRSATQFVNEIL